MAEQQIVGSMDGLFEQNAAALARFRQVITVRAEALFLAGVRAEEVVQNITRRFIFEFEKKGQALKEIPPQIVLWFEKYMDRAQEKFSALDRVIAAHNPERLLAHGYSIARHNGHIIRSVSQVTVGETLEIAVSDGQILTNIHSLS